MKQTVDFYDFKRAFEQCRPDNFSYEGLSLLWDYFEAYEQDTEQEFELDVIGICCDYSEEEPKAIAANYDIDLDSVDEDEVSQAVIDYLCDVTSVLGETASGTIVYQVF